MARPEFYTKIRLAPSDDDPRQLIFVAAPDSPKELPDDLLLLRQDYARTARVTAVLFADEKDIRREIFDLLHQSADRGLRGPNYSIADGRSNLEDARDAIADHGYRVRDRLLKQYMLLTLFLGVVPLLAGIMALLTSGFGYLKPPPSGEPYDPLFAWVLAAFWIPAGAAIGVFGEFALRMQGGLSYEQLMNMDPSRWRPVQRMLITIMVSFIFAFLLAFNAVQIGVGSILLNDFAGKTPALALAVGGVTGLAFVKVRDVIFRLSPDERK